MNNVILRGLCFVQSLAAVAKDRKGVTALEYGLIAAVTAVTLATVLDTADIAVGITETFTTIGTSL